MCRPPVDQRVAASTTTTLQTGPASLALPDSFRFAVISDLHFYKESHPVRLPFFRDTVPGLGIAFFCVTGDITEQGLESEYVAARAALDSIGLPYYVTTGNHDLYSAGSWERFRQTFGPSCYTVVVADRLKLIFLDTAEGLVGQRQFDWLEAELDDNDATVKIVLTHFPSYDGAVPIMWRLASGAERYKLQYYLDSFGVKAYIAGHTHGWRHSTIGNVEHFTNSLAPGVPDYGSHGILVFTFADDSLSWERVRVE